MVPESRNSRQWDPNEWQVHCEELLTAHYGVRVQLVPDRMQGDGGLEAFVADQGVAFQCYAPENPLTIQAQTDGQKRKITTDTSKLLRHSAETAKLIGPGNTIREWVLLTPSFDDKELIKHANMRAEKLRATAHEHDWCHSLIRISVHTDRLFAVELDTLSGVRTSVLNVSSEIEARSTEKADTSPDYETTLARKLVVDPALSASATSLDQYATATIHSYFRGQAEMLRLQRDAPSAHRAIEQCGAVIFEGLAISLAESTGRPTVVVKDLRESLIRLLSERVPGISLDLALVLARFFVATWWIQCPLAFETAEV